MKKGFELSVNLLVAVILGIVAATIALSALNGNPTASAQTPAADVTLGCGTDGDCASNAGGSRCIMIYPGDYAPFCGCVRGEDCKSGICGPSNKCADCPFGNCLTPTLCSCTDWVSDKCNAGGCSNQMRQTRVCNPNGCTPGDGYWTQRCVADKSCVPQTTQTCAQVCQNEYNDDQMDGICDAGTTTTSNSNKNIAAIPSFWTNQWWGIGGDENDIYPVNWQGHTTIMMSPDPSYISYVKLNDWMGLNELDGMTDNVWTPVRPNDHVVYKAWIWTEASTVGGGGGLYMAIDVEGAKGRIAELGGTDGTNRGQHPEVGRLLVPWGSGKWVQLTMDFYVQPTYVSDSSATPSTSFQGYNKGESATPTAIAPWFQLLNFDSYDEGASAYIYGTELYVCSPGDNDYETCGQTAAPSSGTTMSTCKNKVSIDQSVCSSKTCCCSGGTTLSSQTCDLACQTQPNSFTSGICRGSGGTNEGTAKYAPPDGYCYIGLTPGSDLPPFGASPNYNDWISETGKGAYIYEQYFPWNYDMQSILNEVAGYIQTGKYKALFLAIETGDYEGGVGWTTPEAENVLAGRFDSKLAEWSTLLSNFPYPVFVTINGEMNGGWNTIAPVDAPTWKQLWIYIHDRLPSDKIDWIFPPSIPWNFDANSQWGTGYKLEDYYPGDDYVDWIGFDFYPNQFYSLWQQGKTLSQVIDSWGYLNWKPSKPYAITETSAFSDSGSMSWAPTQYTIDYANQLFELLKTHNQIKLINWYRPEDTLLPEASGVLAAYKAQIADPRFLDASWTGGFSTTGTTTGTCQSGETPILGGCTSGTCCCSGSNTATDCNDLCGNGGGECEVFTNTGGTSSNMRNGIWVLQYSSITPQMLQQLEEANIYDIYVWSGYHTPSSALDIKAYSGNLADLESGQPISDSDITSLMSMVKGVNSNFRVFAWVWGNTNGMTDWVSNRQNMIDSAVYLTNKGFDGYHEDLEGDIGNQNYIDYINGLTQALHSANKLSTIATWVASPSLHADYVAQMLYDGAMGQSDFVSKFNSVLTQASSPTIIGLPALYPDQHPLDYYFSIIDSQINNNGPYQHLAGFAIYDYIRMEWYEQDYGLWGAWNNWDTKGAAYSGGTRTSTCTGTSLAFTSCDSGSCCCSGTDTNNGGNTGSLSDQHVYIGAYDGGNFLGSNQKSYLSSLKSYTGKGIAIVGDYESWGGIPDIAHYNDLINSGYAIGLHVQVHPSHNNGDGVQVCTDIYSGVYDDYIRQLAQAVSQVNGVKMIGFGEEMNGFWYSYAGDPDAFRRAMQHLYTVVKSVDSTIQVGMYTVPCWGPSSSCNWEGGPSQNEENTPYIVAGTMDDYYPGDSYCDWWGVDIYSGHSLDRQYSSVEDFYTKTGYLNMHPSKPFVIGEIGASWHDYPDENQEATWMTQMLQFMADHKDRVRYFLYYDMAGVINSGIWLEGLTNHPTFYAAYKAGIANSAFADSA